MTYVKGTKDFDYLSARHNLERTVTVLTIEGVLANFRTTLMKGGIIKPF